MDAEDLEPRTRKAAPKNLEVMSIEALRDYVAELEAEIARVHATIAAKERARAGAETLFKR